MRIISVEILKPDSMRMLQELEELKIIRLVTGRKKTMEAKKKQGFFLTAGLWKKRNINAGKLRNDAWKIK